MYLGGPLDHGTTLAKTFFHHRKKLENIVCPSFVWALVARRNLAPFWNPMNMPITVQMMQTRKVQNLPMNEVPVQNAGWLSRVYVWNYYTNICLQGLYKSNTHQYMLGLLCYSGADPGIYFGGGQTKVPNRKLRAKPESRARSARISRAKPESRARSARELRAKPEPRAKPEKNRGEGSGGGGSVSPSPENFWKIKLETIHFGAYLKQLFQKTNEMV